MNVGRVTRLNKANLNSIAHEFSAELQRRHLEGLLGDYCAGPTVQFDGRYGCKRLAANRAKSVVHRAKKPIAES